MAFKKKPETKPVEDECCGSYCSEAGCCPYLYFDHGYEGRDPDTPDLFPDYYKSPGRRNPDLDNDQD